jgi:hypothetical protein
MTPTYDTQYTKDKGISLAKLHVLKVGTYIYGHGGRSLHFLTFAMDGNISSATFCSFLHS